MKSGVREVKRRWKNDERRHKSWKRGGAQKGVRGNQRIGMRIDREVLSSFNLIVTTSMMQSITERESENRHEKS